MLNVIEMFIFLWPLSLSSSHIVHVQDADIVYSRNNIHFICVTHKIVDVVTIQKCIYSNKDIEIVLETQNELDIVSVSNTHCFTDFHKDNEIVPETQNDLDVVSVQKFID